MSQTTTGLAEFLTESANTIDLTESKQHRLFASTQRRLVLDILKDRADPVELEGLAVTVTRRDDNLDSGDEETVKRVKTTLHHVHLPKMADFGVLDYDVETHQVKL
jgi:hypothetical protein